MSFENQPCLNSLIKSGGRYTSITEVFRDGDKELVRKSGAQVSTKKIALGVFNQPLNYARQYIPTSISSFAESAWNLAPSKHNILPTAVAEQVPYFDKRTARLDAIDRSLSVIQWINGCTQNYLKEIREKNPEDMAYGDLEDIHATLLSLEHSIEEAQKAIQTYTDKIRRQEENSSHQDPDNRIGPLVVSLLAHMEKMTALRNTIDRIQTTIHPNLSGFQQVSSNLLGIPVPQLIDDFNAKPHQKEETVIKENFFQSFIKLAGSRQTSELQQAWESLQDQDEDNFVGYELLQKDIPRMDFRVGEDLKTNRRENPKQEMKKLWDALIDYAEGDLVLARKLILYCNQSFAVDITETAMLKFLNAPDQNTIVNAIDHDGIQVFKEKQTGHLKIKMTGRYKLINNRNNDLCFVNVTGELDVNTDTLTIRSSAPYDRQNYKG
ncbi:MAG: hypothetical protein WB791_04975 [Waddliaceae bacterium]